MEDEQDLSPENIRPTALPEQVATVDEFDAWRTEHAGESAELPWETDPRDMQPLAVVDDSGMPTQQGAHLEETGIVFGGQDDAEAALVTDWAVVDDLGGLGLLWGGSYGGKFYLRIAQDMQATEDAGLVAEEAPGEAGGGLPACQINDGMGSVSETWASAPMPRSLCPMSERETLLKVNGKWRRDLYWDTLLTGTLQLNRKWGGLRHLTLRIVQVGGMICLHSVLSPARFDASGLLVETGAPPIIGYSPFDGLPAPLMSLTQAATSYEIYEHTAQPPWGEDDADAWPAAEEETDALIEAAACPGEVMRGCCGMVGEESLPGAVTPAETPYCRVYPRLFVGEGWFATSRLSSTSEGSDGIIHHPHVSATTVEDECNAWLESIYRPGQSPDWLEERISLTPQAIASLEAHFDALDFEPAAEWTTVCAAHLRLPEASEGEPMVYLRLDTANIDGCLLTAGACSPYNYWPEEGSTDPGTDPDPDPDPENPEGGSSTGSDTPYVPPQPVTPPSTPQTNLYTPDGLHFIAKGSYVRITRSIDRSDPTRPAWLYRVRVGPVNSSKSQTRACTVSVSASVNGAAGPYDWPEVGETGLTMYYGLSAAQNLTVEWLSSYLGGPLPTEASTELSINVQSSGSARMELDITLSSDTIAPELGNCVRVTDTGRSIKLSAIVETVNPLTGETERTRRTRNLRVYAISLNREEMGNIALRRAQTELYSLTPTISPASITGHSDGIEPPTVTATCGALQIPGALPSGDLQITAPTYPTASYFSATYTSTHTGSAPLSVSGSGAWNGTTRHGHITGEFTLHLP